MIVVAPRIVPLELGLELSREDLAKLLWSQIPYVRHECAGNCWGIFICRGPSDDKRGGACGKWVGACVGGSEDNLCADCWVKQERRRERAEKRRKATK